MSIANWNPDLTIPPGTSKASLNGYLDTPFAGGLAPVTPTPPITNMILWLDGQNGIQTSGGHITSWTDRSGNGYVTVPALGTDPSAVLTVTTHGGLNYVHGFDATGIRLDITPLIQAYIAAGYAVFVVAYPTAVPIGENSVAYGVAGGASGGGTGADNVAFGVYTDGKVRMAAGSTSVGFATLESSGPATLNTPAIYSFRANVNSAAIWLKQSGETEQTGAGVGSSGYIIPVESEVGGWTQTGPTVFNWFRGDIAEIIVYSPMPSDVQLAAIRAYLAAKYSVSA